MPVGAEVAASEPAVVGAIGLWTEVRLRIDSPPASSGEVDAGRWQDRRLRARIGPLLTGLTQRFVNETAERLGHFGAFASEFVRLEGCLRCGVGIIGPPDMNDEADQHESDHKELVKQ
jgi:hypothetical protein